eukprot:TRINITY_DN3590_c0_g1_i1.p1 TRINITY_DN3590_c0_g1~~TRINITY_DN3590_c0_g1_i1.p1  ORF type:complete len:1115 (-),score=193.84 TRINITY_DN3590_c0_g1_i1:102-3194(-)
MTGTIPSDIICSWTKIQELTLGVNEISGTIDPCICTLTDIFLISFTESEITGPLPECIGQLTQMKYAWFDSNFLTGTVPDLSSWTDLQQMDLSANLFSGSFPDVSYSLNATVVNVGANNFSGIIPDWLCDLTHLKTLNFQSNEFEGYLPTCVDNLVNMVSFRAAGNNLVGDLPPQIGYMTKVKYLALSSNQFTGVLPSTFSQMDSLLWLDVSNNPFGVTVLDLVYPILTLSNLMYLNIANCSLTGKLDYQLFWNDELESGFVFLNLVNFDMSHNHISGTIPSIVQWWYSLLRLDMSDNDFYGELPPAMASFQSVIINGNPDLHSTEGALPPYLTADESNSVVNNTGHFSCPVTHSKSGDEFMLDPDYYDFSLCACAGNYYGINGTCQPCLSNAYCPGAQTVHVNPGYFPIPSAQQPQLLIPCQTVGLSGQTACNPDGTAPFVCADGHIGRKCAQCKLHHYMYGGRCRNCSDADAGVSAMILVVVVFGVLFIVYRLRPTVRPRGDSFRFSTSSVNISAIQKQQQQNRSGDMTPPELESPHFIPDPETSRDSSFMTSSGRTSSSSSGVDGGGGLDSASKFISMSNMSTMVESPMTTSRMSNSSSPMDTTRFLTPTFEHSKTIPSSSPASTMDDGDMHIGGGISGGAGRLTGEDLVEVKNDKISAMPRGLTSAGTFKITQLYLQMVSSVFSIHFPWPELLSPFSNSASVISLSIGQIFGFGCWLSDPTSYIQNFYMSLAMPGTLMGIGLVLFLIVLFLSYMLPSIRRRFGEILICDFIRYEAYVLFLFYLPTAKLVMSTFNCETDPISGIRYVAASPYVECSSTSEWAGVLPAAIVLLLVYILGFPLVLFIWLVRRRQILITYKMNRRLGFVYQPFRVFWFEFVLILRSLLLSISTSLLPASSALRNFVVLIVLSTAITLHLSIKPFRTRSDNVLEMLSLFSVVITFGAGLIFDIAASHNAQHGTDGGDVLAVAWLVLLIAAFVLAAIVFTLAKNVWHDMSEANSGVVMWFRRNVFSHFQRATPTITISSNSS